VAEAVAAAVSFLTEGEVVLTAFEAFAGAAALEMVAATAYNNYATRRARDKAKQAHNDSLRDRYVMSRSAVAARRIVLGRQRVSGNLSFVKSYGANKEKLVGVLPLSAEEIDGYEGIYFDDELVSLDGSGNVLGVNRREYFTISSTGGTFALQGPPKAGTVSASVQYGSSTVSLGVSVSGVNVTVSGATAGATGIVTVIYQPEPSPFYSTTTEAFAESVTTDGSGNASITLAHVPVTGSVVVSFSSGGDNTSVDVTSFASVSGSTVTITGSPLVSAFHSINYQVGSSTSRARVRVFTGAPGQVADPVLIAALPGVWTSAHVGNGIAYLVFELDYDPDAFPSSLPNISVVVRGSKLYDPRTGLTAWSENPALQTRHVARHPLFGRLSAARVSDDAVIVAANVCDQSTAYVLNGRTYTRPRYTAGLVCINGTKADDIIQDLCEAMGGDRAFVDGQLRVKAGAWATPLQTLDESWLIKEGGAIQVQRRRPRKEIANIISGTFADQESDYQVLPFPTVRSETYIAEDREELPDDLDFNAITFSGQAQQVAAQRMRRKRYGRRISVTCNMRAFAVEWGDVLYVNLPSRFGYLNLPCDVLDTSFTVGGGIQLTLEEVSPTIWEVGASFAEVPLAPNTFMFGPHDLPAVVGLDVDSSNAVQVRNADGTVVQRMRVSWDAFTNQAVLASGGGVEVRYGVASWPESQWLTVRAEAPAQNVDIVGVQQGQLYLVKARSYNRLSSGRWTLPILASINQRSIVVDTGQIAAGATTEVVTVESGYTGESVINSTYGSPSFFGLGVWGLAEFTLTETTEVLVSCSFESTCTSGAAGVIWGDHFIVIRDDTEAHNLKRIRQPIAGGSVFSTSMSLKAKVTLPAGVHYAGATINGHTNSYTPQPADTVLTIVEILKR